MEPNLLKHANLLKGKDPEEMKKVISYLFLTFHKLQHTTSEMGIFLGGMYKGIELILSFIHNKFEIPNSNEVFKHEIDFADFVGPYVEFSFELFEKWKREAEEYQINKGIEVFKSYETAVHKLYKDYQKRSRAEG